MTVKRYWWGQRVKNSSYGIVNNPYHAEEAVLEDGAVLKTICGKKFKTSGWRRVASNARATPPPRNKGCSNCKRMMRELDKSIKKRAETEKRAKLEPCQRGGAPSFRVWLPKPAENPYDAREGTMVLRARLTAAKGVGRPLNKGEVVHHINNDPLDDREQNLALLGEHRAHAQWHAGRYVDPIWTGCENPTHQRIDFVKMFVERKHDVLCQIEPDLYDILTKTAHARHALTSSHQPLDRFSNAMMAQFCVARYVQLPMDPEPKSTSRKHYVRTRTGGSVRVSVAGKIGYWLAFHDKPTEFQYHFLVYCSPEPRSYILVGYVTGKQMQGLSGLYRGGSGPYAEMWHKMDHEDRMDHGEEMRTARSPNWNGIPPHVLHPVQRLRRESVRQVSREQYFVGMQGAAIAASKEAEQEDS